MLYFLTTGFSVWMGCVEEVEQKLVQKYFSGCFRVNVVQQDFLKQADSSVASFKYFKTFVLLK